MCSMIDNNIIATTYEPFPNKSWNNSTFLVFKL